MSVSFYTTCVTELQTLFPNSSLYIKVIWVEATGTWWLQTATNKLCSQMCPQSIHGYSCCISSKWLVEIMHVCILQDKKRSGVTVCTLWTKLNMEASSSITVVYTYKSTWLHTSNELRISNIWELWIWKRSILYSPLLGPWTINTN